MFDWTKVLSESVYSLIAELDVSAYHKRRTCRSDKSASEGFSSRNYGFWRWRAASSVRRWALTAVATRGISGRNRTRSGRVYTSLRRIITYSRGNAGELRFGDCASRRCYYLSFAAVLRARGSRTFAIVASEIGQPTAPMTLIFPNNSHLWPQAAAASDVRRNFHRPRGNLWPVIIATERDRIAAHRFPINITSVANCHKFQENPAKTRPRDTTA